MGLRFRKSINLGGGVRLNFNKKSTGISFGTKGARYSINSNGRKTVSVGIPGTGLYWTQSKGGNSKGSKGNKSNTSDKSGCLMWFFLWPLLIIFYIFFFMIKGILIIVKKIVEILKGNDEKKKKNVYIGLAIFGGMLAITIFITFISVLFSTVSTNNSNNNQNEVIETSNNNENEIEEKDNNLSQDNKDEDKYIYTTEYGEFIAKGINDAIEDDEIIRNDTINSFQIDSDSVQISIYTNKFYSYSTVENKAREITRKLLDFYSTKEYKKEYWFSPSSISIIVDIRGNSKDIYTGKVENTFLVLSQIHFTTEDFNQVSGNVDDYITMSNKKYFGES